MLQAWRIHGVKSTDRERGQAWCPCEGSRFCPHSRARPGGCAWPSWPWRRPRPLSPPAPIIPAESCDSDTAGQAATSGHANPGFTRACAASHSTTVASCMALIRTGITQHPATFFHDAAPTGDGYGPSSFQSAYKLPSSTGGAGQTVAVIEAFNDPKAASDLAAYRAAWGEAPCNTATGVCSAATTAPDGTACDDGNACTQTDTCQAGVCTGGAPVACGSPTARA